MKAKIYLDEGETIESAKELLAKALSLENSIDHTEKYVDPLAEDSLSALNDSVKLLYKKMFEEIGAVIARDVFKL